MVDNKSQRFSNRFYGSALFISGRKANQTFAVLSPYLDFDERFCDLNKLRNELKLREMNVDVESMKKTWEFYKDLDSNKSKLEQKRIDIANRMKVISRQSEQTKDVELEITRLKTLGKTIRQDLKVVKEALWELEETVVSQALKLPNILHPDTPQAEPSILYSSGNRNRAYKEGIPPKSHIEIGASLGLLEYSNPMKYYLLKEAALFELAALRLAANVFSDDNMTRVTGLDFSRSIIVEGSGMDHENPEESFILKDNEEIEKHSSNRMHLIGGASLASFLAMHTKQLINPNHFPLRYFASGRHYAPFSDKSKETGLFTVCQSSAVHVFLLLNKDFSDVEHREEFDRLINAAKLMYDALCSHYRIVVRPAKELRPWESLRVSFELWSPYLSEYVEVGHVSLCGQYFSKRLLIGCQAPQGRTFPSVISGTVLSVPRLLGCLLEEYPEKFVVSDKVRELMPV